MQQFLSHRPLGTLTPDSGHRPQILIFMLHSPMSPHFYDEAYALYAVCLVLYFKTAYCSTLVQDAWYCYRVQMSWRKHGLCSLLVITHNQVNQSKCRLWRLLRCAQRNPEIDEVPDPRPRVQTIEKHLKSYGFWGWKKGWALQSFKTAGLIATSLLGK